MENKPYDRLEIPRNSPKIKALVGRKAVELTWYNSTIYRFSEMYDYMDHLYLKGESGESSYNMFGVPELLRILEENKYPILKSEEPSDSDVNSYIEYTNKKLDREIGEING